ncbi:hypothetical protein ACLOJK_009337 [Asimina triloba]
MLVVVSVIGLLFIGKLLEPIWGGRDYTPFSGFHGVLAGFLVGVKQIFPDQEMGVLKIKAKWIPSLVLLAAIAASLFTAESVSYLPTFIFGTYMSWIYLRYLQRNPETNIKGDPSDEFAFFTFFPEFLRPVIDPIASIFDRLLCRRAEISNEDRDQTWGATPLPGSDPIDASRRRERGARALEERLAAEKTPESTADKDATENEKKAMQVAQRLNKDYLLDRPFRFKSAFLSFVAVASLPSLAIKKLFFKCLGG